MMIFDFFKKLFGWIDEGSRKRKASDSDFESEFIIPKKQHFYHKTAHLPEKFFEIDDDSDSDDIEIIDEQKHTPVNSCNRLNGTHSSRNNSHLFCASPSFTSPSKISFSRENHNKVKKGYFTNKRNKTPDVNNECKCVTLTKTHRLKEKSQYEELLQNFLPHRIHVLHNKMEEQHSIPPIQEPIEVIDLDKSELPSPCKSKAVSGVISHSQWPLLSKIQKDNEKITTPGHSKQNESQHVLPNKIQALKIETSITKPMTTINLKTIVTNTLRDKLAAKAVTRGDYIPQVAKRYNERIEQRCKEAEELKKMTCVLSKHNRLAREAALEEHLARSMRLCEAVLDEREEPEELPLPTLTQQMLKEIKHALIPQPSDEVLVENYGLRITRKDINTLADLNWLNDEVINFYMNLLISRGVNEKFPKVHAMNTFFYPKLISGGHSSLKRWTRKIDIFAQDIVVVPVHLGIHWCMSIIDFRDKSIRYYDSMGSSNTKCLNALQQYLEDESLDKKKKPFPTNDWKLQSVTNIPQQMNGSDCGVFSCMFAEYICANRKITFSQQDMPYFRNKMVYEILNSKLL